MGRLHISRLHRKDDLLGGAVPRIFVVEIQAAINAPVCAFFPFQWPRPNQAERPPLKLIRIVCGEFFRAREVNWFADDFVGIADFFPECVIEAFLDETYGKMGDVNADPAAVQTLGYGDGSAASAEGVEKAIALIGARFYDPFEDCLRLLRRIAQSFRRKVVHNLYI